MIFITTVNRKIKKILKDIQSLKKESRIRFAFSYIDIGKNLDDIDADIIHNIKDDLPSKTLMMVIEDRLFENPEGERSMGDLIEERETMAKLHMFNLFNKNKKFEA